MLQEKVESIVFSTLSFPAIQRPVVFPSLQSERECSAQVRLARVSCRDFGFRVQGLGFTVLGLGFRVSCRDPSPSIHIQPFICSWMDSYTWDCKSPESLIECKHCVCANTASEPANGLLLAYGRIP